MKAYRLRSLAEADSDIEAVFSWYEAELPGLGDGFLLALESAYARIKAGPEVYPSVAPSARRAFLRGFPYSVYFTIGESDVVVVAVIHHARDPEILRSRLA